VATLRRAICADAELPAEAVLDRLPVLVDNSLVHRTIGADDEPRFGMLETVRDLASESCRSRPPAAWPMP
jgi:hypothetical protein